MATTESVAHASGPESLNDQGQVSLENLSNMTGFPIEFLKKELMIEEENLSLEELRSSVLNYLDSHFGNELN